MNPSAPAKPLSVSLLALPESTPLALYGLYEVFASVGVTWPLLTGETGEGPKFDVRIVSTDGRDFRCAMGTPISPDAGIGDVARTDIVLIADLSLPPDADPRGRWPSVTQWIRDQWERGATVGTVCTGSLMLADAGLLDGGEATTHWSAAGLFAEYFPAVALKPERIIVPCGEDDRLITGGGASSWEDLALYMIARFCGQAEAVRTAKVFLFGDRGEGQLPYAVAGIPSRHEDAVIADSQVWIAENYSAARPVARMVERSKLAERTFKRRFKAATGYTPVAYVQALRVEEAKQLLETTDEAADTIGHLVGYEDPTFFRRLFKRSSGTTPARYRQRFKSIGRTHLPGSGDAGREKLPNLPKP